MKILDLWEDSKIKFVSEQDLSINTNYWGAITRGRVLFIDAPYHVFSVCQAANYFVLGLLLIPQATANPEMVPDLMALLIWKIHQICILDGIMVTG